MLFPFFDKFDIMNYTVRSAASTDTVLDTRLFGSTSGTTVLTSICSKHQTPAPDCKMCKSIFHLPDKRK